MHSILVVEDDVAIARGLRDTLTREGYRVLVENDGMKGYQRARKDQPDLVVLDVMLPTMDGFKVCSLLKQEGFGAPVFLLTGLTQERSRLEGLGRGADDYIGKPFNIRELVLRIQNTLKQRDALKEKTRQMEDELLKARQIQMKSLPRVQPRVPGLDIYGRTVPAVQVGGDYFDFLKIDRKRIGIIVADVSGKGMPAAMYVQKMQGIVQSTRKRVRTAPDILTALQEHMHESMDTTSFITAVVALFDLDAGTIELAEAGHLPVLFVRNGKVRLLKPPGIWIGKTSSGIFEKSLRMERITIRTGDLFVFYSDGIIEARNARGQEFGLLRLRKVVSAPALRSRRVVERCFKEVTRFSASEAQSDDITMVAVRIASHHHRKKDNAR